MKWQKLAAAALAAFALFACTAPSSGPSQGTYTVSFPSTAAAVATDTVQLLLFDVPQAPADRAEFCQTLIQERKRADTQRQPSLSNQPVNICELLLGRKPLTIPYGEAAVLAIARHKGTDLMTGCVIQTFGDGDAPVDIPLALVDVGVAIPATDCTRVADFCAQPQKCTAQ